MEHIKFRTKKKRKLKIRNCIIFILLIAIGVSLSYIIYIKKSSSPEESVITIADVTTDITFDENINEELYYLAKARRKKISEKRKFNSHNINEDYVTEETEQRIVCWGDSMTQGTGSDVGFHIIDGESYDISFFTFPGILGDLTDISSINMGISGETSDQIVNRALDYYLESNIHNDILILEIGSNGGWDNYDDLIKQYKRIIKWADTEKYIIVGDTDDPGTSIADIDQEEMDENGNYYNDGNYTPWETALSEAFGEHFINMRLYVMENGISDNNLTLDENDIYYQSIGKIPERLRYDWTHFNAYGYYSQAIGVYKKGLELGYW